MKYKKKRIFKKKVSCLKITRKRETSLICLKANEYSAKHAWENPTIVSASEREIRLNYR